MFWFAVLVMMANALNKYSMITWISEGIVSYVDHFDWLLVFLVLILVYFYTRYFFASAMAHFYAIYLAFLAVAISVGVPPLLAALTLGYTSNLSVGLTHNGPDSVLWRSYGFISITSIVHWRVKRCLPVRLTMSRPILVR